MQGPDPRGGTKKRQSNFQLAINVTMWTIIISITAYFVYAFTIGVEKRDRYPINGALYETMQMSSNQRTAIQDFVKKHGRLPATSSELSPLVSPENSKNGLSVEVVNGGVIKVTLGVVFKNPEAEGKTFFLIPTLQQGSTERSVVYWTCKSGTLPNPYLEYLQSACNKLPTK